jgi:hypothetical protein
MLHSSLITKLKLKWLGAAKFRDFAIKNFILVGMVISSYIEVPHMYPFFFLCLYSPKIVKVMNMNPLDFPNLDFATTRKCRYLQNWFVFSDFAFTLHQVALSWSIQARTANAKCIIHRRRRILSRDIKPLERPDTIGRYSTSSDMYMLWVVVNTKT